jgi:hypothetical protein
MNTLTCGLAAALLLCACASVIAGSATDLNVNGRIIPDACNVVLSEGGVIDHGKIPARSLKQDEFTVLPGQFLELQITCAGPMLFALVGLDGRADSSLAPGFFYGLGKNPHAPTERLGSVSLSYRNSLGDGHPMQVLASADKGQHWIPEPNAFPKHYMGFSQPGDMAPGALARLISTLRVDTSINAATYLSLDQEVPLDGAIVLDLQYL